MSAQKRLFHGFVLLLGILFASVASVASLSVFDQESLVKNFYWNVGAFAPAGQEFMPTLHAVDTVHLWIEDASCSVANPSGGAVQIRLHEGTINGPILATSQIVEFPNCFNDVVQFQFPAYVPLTPDETYVIEVYVPAGHFYAIAGAGGSHEADVYDRGRQILNGTPQPENDFWFREGIDQFLAISFHQCMDGGWETLVRADGTPFTELSACIDYTVSHPAPATGSRFVAPAGTDVNNDCSQWSRPCVTIQHAINEAEPGNNIRVKAGIYTEENILIDKPVIIQGQGAARTIIQAADSPDTAVAPVLSLSSGDYHQRMVAAIKNVTVRHGRSTYPTYGAAGIAVPANGALLLYGVDVTNNNGIGIQNQGNMALIHSTVRQHPSSGIDNTGWLFVDSSLIQKNDEGIDHKLGGAEIVDSAINNNHGTGIYNDTSMDLILRRSSVSNNYYGMESAYSSIHIEDSQIHNNVSNGLNNYRETFVTILRTTILDNGGSGIYGDDNYGTVVEDSLISGNGRDGVAIYDHSHLALVRSIISHNGASGINLVSGKATVDNSIIRLNSRSGIGTDYSPSGTGPCELTVRNSTISQNTTPASGGGIQAADCVDIRNSTISGNRAAGSGGGIYFAEGDYDHCDPRVLNNVTITANVADDDRNGVGDGGGIFAEVDGLLLSNSILTGNLDRSPKPNASYADCAGPLTSQGYNLFGSLAGCTLTGDTTGNIVGVPPLLGPLADNGGFTPTHALLAGSPALDAANPAPPNTAVHACEPTDQRGLPRYGRCDMGAYEWQGE